MPSKEHEALIEQIGQLVYKAQRHGSNPNHAAREIISTILAAIVEADTAMLQAAQDAWLADPCRKSSTFWRAMLKASALGEQSE